MRKGPFSEQAIVDIPDDLDPPSAPSTPAIATRLGIIHVAWDGLTATGTAMPTDFERVKVWMADPLAPGSAQVVDSMRAAETVVVGGQPYNANREFWLTAVDRSRNESASSGRVIIATKPLVDTDLIGKILNGANIIAGTVNAADAVIANTVTGNLIQANAVNTGHLQANAVTAPLIAAGAVTAGKLEAVLIVSNRIVAGNANGARVELNSGGIGMWNSAGVQTVMMAAANGSFAIRTALSGARVQLDANGLRAYNANNQQTVEISSATGTASLIGQLSSGPSGRRIVVSPDDATDPEIRFYDDNGSTYSRIVAPPRRNNQTNLEFHSSNYWLAQSRLTLTEQLFKVSYKNDAGAETFIVGHGSAIELREASGGGRLLLNWDGSAAIWGNKVSLDASGGEIYLFGNPVRVEGALWVNGNSKTFIIDHPVRDDSYLIHATTESPHNGVEYWGSTVLDDCGKARIELPSYFEALTQFEGRAVFTTPSAEVVTYPQGGAFDVVGQPGQRMFWLVKAIRQDVPPLLVEPRRDQVRVHGDGPYKHYSRAF
ncbi:hypothetical protein [Nonomuraea endophytica]|uniref:hypothetical protein n=1 Tax=Nonomuraea endophytica TaxID=714136 RepID=UPI0037C5E41D